MLSHQYVNGPRYSYLRLQGFATDISAVFTLAGTNSAVASYHNLGYGEHSSPLAISHNRRAFAQAIGAPRQIAGLVQVHGSDIAVADSRSSCWEEPDTMPNADALVTGDANLGLAVITADCVPILIAGTGNGPIAAIHAGWRGTLAGIATATVAKISAHYATPPEQLQAVIGPAICGACYQVSGELCQQFRAQSLSILPENHLDLGAINKLLLLQAGLIEANIYRVQLCTYCSTIGLFSHRRRAVGRQAAIIWRGAGANGSS